jgi:hypothetical protein
LHRSQAHEPANGGHQAKRYHEKGVYGLSVHNEPGGGATVQPINSEADLLARLLAFGVTQAGAEDIIERLKNKHDSVKIEVDAA